MPQLSDFDEHFVHQIPEPLGVVGIEHPHWRESYFFVTHGARAESDVVVVAMATYPPRGMLDALVLGRVGGELVFRHYQRPAGRRPPHLHRGPGVGRDRGALPARPRRRRRRRRIRRRPDLRGPHRGLRLATGSAARRRGRPAVGPEPHDPVGHLPRHLPQRDGGRRPSTAGWASETTPGGCATTAVSRCGHGSPSNCPTGCSGSGTGSSPTGRTSSPTGAGHRPAAGTRSRCCGFRPRPALDRRAGAPVDYGPDGAAVERAGRHGVVRAGGRHDGHGARRRTMVRALSSVLRRGPAPDGGGDRRRPPGHGRLRGDGPTPPPFLPRAPGQRLRHP